MRPHRLPNDPGFPGQWFLHASEPGSDGTTASAVDAVAAWDVTTGSPAIVVAVIDTGVRFDHPDLLPVADGGKLLPGYDFVSAESGGTARAANDGDGWDGDPSDPGDWISSSDRTVSQFSDCRRGQTARGTARACPGCSRRSPTTPPASPASAGTIASCRCACSASAAAHDSDIIAGMRWAAGLAVAARPPTPLRRAC